MSTRHWLIVERDEAYLAQHPDDPDHPALTYAIECSDVAACPGWIECMEDHSGAPEDDGDDDEVTIHGVPHTYRYGYGWVVDYPGCPVQGAAHEGDDMVEIGRSHGPGRYELDVDWDDDFMGLTVAAEQSV